MDCRPGVCCSEFTHSRELVYVTFNATRLRVEEVRAHSDDTLAYDLVGVSFVCTTHAIL